MRLAFGYVASQVRRIDVAMIAAVKMYASSAAPDPAQDATPTVQRRKRNVEPEVVQDATPEPLQVADGAQDDATPTIDARAQALQMANEGMNASQIAKALDANYSTVRSWLKRAQVQHTNGVAQ